MNGKEFDPILERAAEILREARPGSGTHLSDQEVFAFASRKLREGDRVPDHLRKCPRCWNRVFAAKRQILREAASARLAVLSVPIAILEKAVEFLTPIPGLHPVYAFSVPAPGGAIRASLEPSAPAAPAAPPAPSELAERPVDEMFSGAPDEAPPTRGLFRFRRAVEHRVMENAFLASSAWEAPAPVPEQERKTDAIPLPVAGFGCYLTVKRLGDLCSLELVARVPETGAPIPGVALLLRVDGIEYAATVNEMGIALLEGIPAGQYDLAVEVPPTL